MTDFTGIFLVLVIALLGFDYLEKLPDYSCNPAIIHENYKACKEAGGTAEGCNKAFCKGLCDGRPEAR